MAAAAPALQLPWHVHWSKPIAWMVGIAIVAIASLIGWHKYIAHRDQADHDQAVIQHEKVQADTLAASQSRQQVQQLQAQNDRLQQQNVLLAQEVQNAISTRNSQTAQRIQIESTAPLADVTRRWAELAKAPDGSIRAGTDGTVSVTDSGARATTRTLEDGATAVANFTDVQRLDVGKDAQIASLNALVKSEQDSASKVQLLMTDKVNECKADLKVARDEGAKKARHSFWRGLGIGAAAAGAIALRFL